MESILTHKALHLLHLALSALLHLFGTKCSIFCARVQEVQSANGARWWFYFCTGLQEAYIGDGVTEIAAKAFAECTALKTVVIGKSIQRIGDQAFNTRSSWDQMTLEKITVLFDDIASGSFPVLESGSRGVFPKPGGWDLVSYKIYVPKGTKAEYQKNWSDYSSLIVEMQ